MPTLHVQMSYHQKMQHESISTKRQLELSNRNPLCERSKVTTYQLSWIAVEAREALDEGDTASAAAVLREALLRFPRWIEGYWLLGQILRSHGYTREATVCFWTVANATPDDPRSYEALATLAAEQGQITEAITLWRRTLEVGGPNPGAAMHLHRLVGDTNAAQQALSSPGAQLLTNARTGRYAQALQHADNALAQEPHRLDLLLATALSNFRLKKWSQTKTQLQHILNQSPDCLKALALLSYLDSHQRKALLHEISLLDPENHTLVWLHAQLEQSGRSAKDYPARPLLITWQSEVDQKASPPVTNSNQTYATGAQPADPPAPSKSVPSPPQSPSILEDSGQSNPTARSRPQNLTSSTISQDATLALQPLELQQLSKAEEAPPPAVSLLKAVGEVWPSWLSAPASPALEDSDEETPALMKPRLLPLQLGSETDLQSLAGALEQHLRNTSLQGGLPISFTPQPSDMVLPPSTGEKVALSHPTSSSSSENAESPSTPPSNASSSPFHTDSTPGNQPDPSTSFRSSGTTESYWASVRNLSRSLHRLHTSREQTGKQ